MLTDTHPDVRFKQVKITVDTNLALAFREACSVSGTSMAAMLAQFMAEYTHTAQTSKTPPVYSSRRRRLSAIKSITKQLQHIKAAEQRSLSNTPANFQETENYERTEEIIDLLDQAIEILGEIL